MTCEWRACLQAQGLRLGYLHHQAVISVEQASVWATQVYCHACHAESAVLGEAHDEVDDNAKAQSIFQQLLPMPSDVPLSGQSGESAYFSQLRVCDHGDVFM